jgi:hypothetical protein
MLGSQLPRKTLHVAGLGERLLAVRYRREIVYGTNLWVRRPVRGPIREGEPLKEAIANEQKRLASFLGTLELEGNVAEGKGSRLHSRFCARHVDLNVDAAAAEETIVGGRYSRLASKRVEYGMIPGEQRVQKAAFDLGESP